MTDKSAIDVIYQDLHHIQSVLSDLESRFAGLNRFVRYDEQVAQAEKDEVTTSMVRAMTTNTEAVSELVQVIRAERAGDEVPYFGIHKRRRRNEIALRSKHLDYLTHCKQKVTPVCPCGKHKGIQFLDKGKVVEEVCPKSWWITQSRLAYDDGRLEEFTSSTPLSEYLSRFKK